MYVQAEISVTHVVCVCVCVCARARAIGLGGVSGLARRWMRCVITTYHVNAPAMVIARLEHSHAVNFAIPHRTAPHRATPQRFSSYRPVVPAPKTRSGVSVDSRMKENSRRRGTLKGMKRKRCVLRFDKDISILNDTRSVELQISPCW